MKMVLILALAIVSSFAISSEGDFSKVGKFNCKSSALLFPGESPNFKFSLRLEAVISTKEDGLSYREDMSKAQILMAYMIKKTDEYSSQEEGNLSLKESFATRLPYSSPDYNLVNYKVVLQNRTTGYREIYLTIPTDFNNHRKFAMTLDIGELDNRNVEPFKLTCKNLDYPY